MSKKTYLAKRLKSARNAAGMTLSEAGDSVGKSSKAISAYEAAINLPSVDTLIGLCKSYGVEISYFFQPVHGEPQGDDMLRLCSLYDMSSEYGKDLIIEYARMVSNEHPKK